MQDTQPSGRAMVPEAADGQSVDRSGSLQLPLCFLEDGSARPVVEVVAEELGSSLRWATATPVKATRNADE
jgi:hypothetical protein